MHPVYTYGPTAELWSDDYEVSGHYGKGDMAPNMSTEGLEPTTWS